MYSHLKDGQRLAGDSGGNGMQPLRKPDGLPGDAPPRFYTVSETAGMLRTSAITVYRAINDGEFPAVRVRGRLIIPAKVIDALIEAAVESRSLVDAADWVTPSDSVRLRRHRTESNSRTGPAQAPTSPGPVPSAPSTGGYGEDATSANRSARSGGAR